MISRKAKEATKTALAMTIAYGIALAMDWDRPYWAGFAVAFISLSTVGQSVNRAALRVSGTALGAMAALILIALFSQDRWEFMVSLSLYLSVCAYMMSGPRHQYFWQVSGMVCVIVAFDAGPDPVQAFDTAVIRAQQTGLGILVYSLVAMFLWPVNSRPAFTAATRDLATTQHQLFRVYAGLLTTDEGMESARQLRAKETQQRTRFGQLLDAAETDSHEIRESGQQWRRYQRLATRLAETMERWRESFVEIRTLDLPRLLPDLNAFNARIERRLARVESMLTPEHPDLHQEQSQQPSPEAQSGRRSETTGLRSNGVGVAQLSHFDRAAITVMQDALKDLDRLTVELCEAAGAVRGDAEAEPHGQLGQSPAGHMFLPDPDRMGYVIRYLTIIWIAFLGLVYVDGLPGGAGFGTMAGAIGIVLATAPQMPVSMLYAPVALGISLAGILYIFLMPQLGSFVTLGLMIFAVTFFFCYVFADPRQMLGRAFGLALFGVIASISNDQTYSFLKVANTSLMFVLIFLVLALTVYFPISWRPERVFNRLIRRYFRSCRYLVCALSRDPDRPLTRRERWLEAFHLREASTIPAKLAGWAPHLDSSSLASAGGDSVQGMIAGLQELAARIRMMRNATDPTRTDLLLDHLRDDISSWQEGMADVLERLSVDPAAGDGKALRGRLNQFLVRLETRIRETLDGAGSGQSDERNAEHIYRLLGAYRAVSEALVAYAERTGSIDWPRLREERF